MEKLGRKIVNYRIPIFIISLLLLIPASIGYLNTRVNYDILSYLPGEIETMKGQDILVDEFGTGAYSMFICEGMENKDVAALKEKIEDVDHVAKVVWFDSVADIRLPMEMLPDKLRSAFSATVFANVNPSTLASTASHDNLIAVLELDDFGAGGFVGLFHGIGLLYDVWVG